jgi:hypothetical protein
MFRFLGSFTLAVLGAFGMCVIQLHMIEIALVWGALVVYLVSLWSFGCGVWLLLND